MIIGKKILELGERVGGNLKSLVAETSSFYQLLSKAIVLIFMVIFLNLILLNIALTDFSPLDTQQA